MKGLVHGGPCHLSCQVGVGDVVTTVDGTPVGGDIKYAKQLFLGDSETGVTLGLMRNGIGMFLSNHHVISQRISLCMKRLMQLILSIKGSHLVGTPKRKRTWE